jgi:hypothetical protein
MNDDGRPQSLTIGVWPVIDSTVDNMVSNLVWAAPTRTLRGRSDMCVAS